VFLCEAEQAKRVSLGEDRVSPGILIDIPPNFTAMNTKNPIAAGLINIAVSGCPEWEPQTQASVTRAAVAPRARGEDR
jgi:hypothetical protein